MRIFAKKAFRFDHPDGRNAAEPVYAQALSFHDVPDWVEKSRMFQLATLDGDVTVVETKAQEIAAEVSATAKRGKKAQSEAGE